MGIRRLQAIFILVLPATVVLRCFWMPSLNWGSAAPLSPAPARLQAKVPPPPRGPPRPPSGRRLVFEVSSRQPEHDVWGVGLSVDPILRRAREYLFADQGRANLVDTGRSKELLAIGLTSFRQALNRTFAAHLRTRLKNLEQDLSRLPQDDMRWCHRYCKNMFIFAPALRSVAHALGSAFLEQLGTQQLFLMNDEISYNVHGEPHFDGWHLDENAWLSLPDDAWGWTIYIPLDDGSRDAGGGWLRFRDKQNSNREWDEEFGPGDVLIFDRWIWHRLHDFIRDRPPRLAYLLRVTNDTRVVDLPLSPQFHEPLAKKLKFPVGWQINYYCQPFSHTACRPRMGGVYDPAVDEVETLQFEVDADASVTRTQTAGGELARIGMARLQATFATMGRRSLFGQMPDARCEIETDVPSQGRAAVSDQNGACSSLWWQRFRREGQSVGAGDLPGAAALIGGTGGAAACRNVVVELPPVLPRCVRWLHCAREDDLVSTMLIEHRDQGGFADCLLMLPVLLWHVEARGGGLDALDDVLALDVGANIGSCTLLLLAAGLRVVAFEPVDHNRQHLSASALQNPSRFRDRLALLPFGLASKARSAYMVSQQGNAGNSHVSEKGASTDDRQAFADDPDKIMLRSNEVALRRLDDLTASCDSKSGIGAIAIMKVDVQGFEFEVLSGARELLQSGGVGAILFECEAGRLALHSQVAATDLFKLLRDVGFMLISQSGDIFVPGSEEALAAQCDGLGVNVLALHSAAYPAFAGAAIAACLRGFWSSRGNFDFTTLVADGRCRREFARVLGSKGASQ